jgi:pimeloyl-ACP methyl ester carboxylesterase
MRPAAILAATLLSSASASAAPCPAPDQVTRVSGSGECLIIKTYAKNDGAARSTLFVLLHGNHTSGSPATSQYSVAQALADKGPPGTIAVAMIRPGYNDDTGSYSSGSAAGRADNFTGTNIDIVADAVVRLKAHHKADRLVLIGHSGGAAMAGVMLGRHPGLADAAVLVACPCNVPAWRVMSGRYDMAWTSESAIDYVAKVPPLTRVSVLVGAGDKVTPPILSKEYAEALKRRGIAAELVILEGIDHVGVIDSPRVVTEALRLGE